MFIRIALILSFSLNVMAVDATPPFEKYPTEAWAGVAATKVHYDSKFSKRFKTLLSQEIKSGPDFAEKYRIIRIGCGSGCVGIGVLDCETGEAFDGKMTVEQNDLQMVKLGERLEYKKDSRLLVMRGCINEDQSRCGTTAFEWKGNRFKKVSFVRN